MKYVILSSFLFLSALIAFPVAQMRVIPLDEAQGHVALGLALRHLANTGIFMHTAAHPDDENNGLLVMLNRGQGYRTALSTATCCYGGQNEIVPETSGRITRINSCVYDPLLGKTYSEIGSEARSMHKCQGAGQLLSLPAPAAQSSYQLVETTLPGQMQKDETSLFDGVDSSIASLASFAGARPPKDLTEGLKVMAAAVSVAQKAFDTGTDESTLKPILDGLFAVRVLRRALRTMPIDDAAKYDVDFRLRQKEGEFQQAAVIAKGLKVEVLADDGVVVPVQQVQVHVIVANRGAGEVAIKQVRFTGFEGESACAMTSFTAGGFGFPGIGRGGRGGRGGRDASAPLAMSSVRRDQVAHCEPTLTIPANARVSEPYWHREGQAGRYTFDQDAPFGLPMRPTPFYVQVTLGMPGGEEVIQGMPVQYRYEGDIFGGEKRTELLVVP